MGDNPVLYLLLVSSVSLGLTWLAFRSEDVRFRIAGLIPGIVGFVSTAALVLRLAGVRTAVDLSQLTITIPIQEVVLLATRMSWLGSIALLIIGGAVNYLGEQWDSVLLLIASYLIIALALISLEPILTAVW